MGGGLIAMGIWRKEACRVRVIAVLFLIYGARTCIWGAVLVVPFFFAPPDVLARVDEFVPEVAQYALPPAMWMVGAFAILAGVGRWRRAEWGRPTATLMALVSLPFVPVGTVFGLLALWWLSRTARAIELSAAPAPSASA